MRKSDFLFQDYGDQHVLTLRFEVYVHEHVFLKLFQLNKLHCLSNLCDVNNLCVVRFMNMSGTAYGVRVFDLFIFLIQLTDDRFLLSSF